MRVHFRRIAAPWCALALCAAFANPAPALAEPYEDNPDAAARDPDYAAGKAALEKLGVWASISGKLAQAENVRAALLLVSRGEAPAGIVYQTDAAADPNVSIIGTFPEDAHPPIVYPIALTANASHPDAAAFLAYIKSTKAKPLFEAQGFSVLSPGQS